MKQFIYHVACLKAAGPIFDVEETRQMRMLLNKLLEAIDNANARTAEKLKR